MILTKLTFLMPSNKEVKSNSNTFNWGKLILDDGINKTSFMASSGLSGYQDLRHSGIRRKGRLPSHEQAKLAHYTLNLNAIDLPTVKGVNGLFYPILPFEVNASLGKRSDLGIHFDANVEGSSGCIVIKQVDHWEIFKKAMKFIASKGIKSIPLYVY